jgi:hypothetical protein
MVRIAARRADTSRWVGGRRMITPETPTIQRMATFCAASPVRTGLAMGNSYLPAQSPSRCHHRTAQVQSGAVPRAYLVLAPLPG